MSILLEINGNEYPYPEPLDNNWGQDATNWAQAVTTGMLQKAGGAFTLLAEIDFGPNFGLKSIYYKTRSTNIAAAGQFRLAHSDNISWRNQANNGDLALSVDASDKLLFNGSPIGATVTTSDTNSIDLTFASDILSADLKLSAASAGAGYILSPLTIETDGLVARTPILVGDSGFGGVAGVAPAPAAGDQLANKFLAASGAWEAITPITTGDLLGTNILVTNGTGAVVTPTNVAISIPQSVATSASPTFAGMTLTSFNGVVKASSGALSASLLVNADVSGSAAIVYSKLSLAGSIVNADIASGAAIAYSKLALNNSIVNTDIAAAAAIAYSKLNLTGSIVNADVNASAAIAYSKLNLATSIVNADISASAAIVYSKLNLTGGIVNADVNASAAIAYSKLSLSGSIVNADISASAAIAYSKLNLATSIVNADVAVAAAIARTKLASGTNYRILANSSLGVMSENAAITASSAVASDANGQLVASSTTATELGYVSGATSSIQTQITNVSNYYVNYITNGSFEVNTSGWATFADAAGTQPVDGTGGSPTVSLSRSTTTPLRNSAQGNFVKTAVNSQGQGMSYDFSIASADQGRVLQITFDYKLVSGTYATGDMSVWVYDVTNAVLLPQPSASSIVYNVNAGQGACTFQTAINSTSYRLIFFCGSTSALAYTMAFDTIYVGPQIRAFGSPDTDWVLYVPTFTGWGSVVTSNVFWRRRGSNIEITGTFTAATATAVEARISFPAGPVAASTITASRFIAGSLIKSTTGAFAGYALCEPNVSYLTFGAQTASFAGTAKALGSDITSSSNLSFQATVPIQGWSSNVVMSADANTRVVACIVKGNPASATTGNAIIFPTISQDTHGGYNATTGVYTFPVTGFYQVSAGLYCTTASNFIVYAQVNGATRIAIICMDQALDFGNGSALIFVNAGDTMLLFPSSNTGVIQAVPELNGIQIHYVSGPAQIAASESVNMGYSNTAGTSIANTGFTNTPFSTKAYDSHNAYNTSTGIYTVPAPGKYRVSCAINFASATYGVNNQIFVAVYKNGSVYQVGGVEPIMAIVTLPFGGSVETTIPCVSGDQLEIRVQNTRAAGATTLDTTAGYNHLEINRTGS